MDIHQFINRMIEKTENAECSWVDVSSGYRIILRLGDVVFHVIEDDLTSAYAYSLVLSDRTGPFASYSVDKADNYDEQLYEEMNRLRIAIERWKNQIVLQKMQALFDEL